MPNNNIQQAQFLQSGNPETETRATDLYPGLVGSHLVVQDPLDSKKAKEYQCILTDSVMDVVPAANLVAYWLDQAGYRVTTDVSVAGRGNPAGILRCAAGLDKIAYIQIKGECEVEFQGSPTAAPTAAGLIVIPSATDGVADCLAAGSAATYPPLGTSASTATANVATVNLNLPGRP